MSRTRISLREKLVRQDVNSDLIRAEPPELQAHRSFSDMICILQPSFSPNNRIEVIQYRLPQRPTAFTTSTGFCPCRTALHPQRRRAGPGKTAAGWRVPRSAAGRAGLPRRWRACHAGEGGKKGGSKAAVGCLELRQHAFNIYVCHTKLLAPTERARRFLNHRTSVALVTNPERTGCFGGTHVAAPTCFTMRAFHQSVLR